MKLSEMTTDRAMDVLCEITPCIANITADEELLAELRNAIDPKAVKTKAELMVKVVEKITKLAPIVLKKRKADVFGILAALNEKTAEEIGKQNIIATMAQVREVVKDKDLMDFFKSCVGSEGSE
jgi:hypothetical protein